MSLLVGLDFGTEAVRAVLLNSDHGELLARSARSYADGVIDVVLPGEGLELGEGWALQNPRDWLLGVEDVVRDRFLGPGQGHAVHGERVGRDELIACPVPAR